jgi:AcrR family transcriptional regulator
MHATETRNGTDTRDRILDAAEALFAEHGLEASSMRMITTKAGCNLAAVNYHFGSKDQLIQEVFRRRLTWLNRERLRVLDQLEAAARGAPLKPRQIIEAFFGVALEMAADTEGGGHAFMRLLGRTDAEPYQFVRSFLAEEYAPVLDRFKRALYRALPGVPEEEILWRLHFMLGAMSYALSGADVLKLAANARIPEHDPAAIGPRLMSFLLGGLRAPLPQEATRGVANGKVIRARPRAPRKVA